ncbi:MAG: flagellar hook protein FlgE, partial [Dasania sp.]
NIDEQTQQALFLQKIYQANAVLLRTVDEMMETIINL